MEKPRILIIEDEPLIGTMVEDILEHSGYSCVGNCTTLASAATLVRTRRIDASLLDIGVRGDNTYLFCELLEELSIPFGLVTGISRHAIAPKWQHKPYCGKPFIEEDIVDLLSSIMSQRSQFARRPYLCK